MSFGLTEIRRLVADGSRTILVAAAREPAGVPFRVVTSLERAARFGQEPVTVLLTGLPGSGKSTIARALERRLFDKGRAVAVLDDGEQPCEATFRRAIRAAKLLNEAGLIAICGSSVPTVALRRTASAVLDPNRLVEIHLSAPPAVCRRRVGGDADSLNGGDDARSYEMPTAPDLVVPTHIWHVSSSVDAIVRYLHRHRILR